MTVMINTIRIPIVHCTAGVYLRWWFNGWHYFCFTNGYEVQMRVSEVDKMTTQLFSVISRIVRPTKLTAEYAYSITVASFTPDALDAFAGLLLAERVEQYDGGAWYVVSVTRNEHTLAEAGEPANSLTFEVTRKELPNTPAVYQRTQLLYIGDTLCDLDDGEVIPINKQVNDIAEMQDRQSDFTASFKVRKTRAMRALFELSGEVGANTTFPYTAQTAKLVQDGIETITAGRAVLLRSDDHYYHIAVYSGNVSFFKAIAGLKMADLALGSVTWNASNAAQTHVNDYDYLFPLLEPSDDGGLTPLTDDGSTVELYAGWVWPFVKVKAIWDAIFAAAGYTCTGDILTDPVFTRLFMPISSLKINYIDTAVLLYNVNVANRAVMTASSNRLNWGFGTPTTVLSYFGDSLWRYSAQYMVKYAGAYTYRVTITNPLGVPTNVYLYAGAVLLGEMLNDGFYSSAYVRRYAITYDVLKDWGLVFYCTYNNGCTNYKIECTAIDAPKVAYGSDVPFALHLPALTQTDFIKMVCNLFGLVPDASPRDKRIRFWNYSALLDNIPTARDWSAYLSEAEDETEFAFGDYAQLNYLRYKASNDVVEDNGTGVMQIDDENLPREKDVVSLPVSTCDEVLVLTDVAVSRINMNKYDAKEDDYEQNETIEPRLVYVDTIPDASPAKTFTLRTAASGGVGYDVTTIRKACSLPIAFSSLPQYYSTLAKMLTKTNLRRAKFNLPAYEVAGFKHDTPVYLSQYKAYFYVNKISNYVVGKLCTIELIKL